MTEIGSNFVGAQQALGTVCLETKFIKVCIMACFVALDWDDRGNEHSPAQKNAEKPEGA